MTPVDVIFDTVGGKTLVRSWELLKPGGRLITIAASAEQTEEPRVRDAFFIVEPKQAQLAEIARLIDAGELRPIVGLEFPLAQARRAYQDKPLHGKVVLNVVAPPGDSSSRRIPPIPVIDRLTIPNSPAVPIRAFLSSVYA